MKLIVERLGKVGELHSIAIRNDDFQNEISRIFEQARISFARKYSPHEAEILTKNYADKTIKWNKAQISAQFVRVLGLDIVGSEPYLKPLRDNFVTQNVDLITSISEDHFTKIENMVRTAASNGTLNRELAGDILKNFGNEILQRTANVEARAKLIARDQIAKLNSNLAQARQQNLGIEEYIWRTSEDERVRDSHEKMNGKKFSWGERPNVGGRPLHPGEDYQCRCTAEPVFINASVLENTELGKVLK